MEKVKKYKSKLDVSYIQGPKWTKAEKLGANIVFKPKS